MSRADLTARRLREVLHYDPDTGVFTWLVGRGRGIKPGTIASAKNLGYIQIGIDGCRYLAHRLAFLYLESNWPSEHIDHINGIRHDNRLVNLRLASRNVNCQNLHKPCANNKSGFLGVYWHKKQGAWRASIDAGGRKRDLGSFETPDKAHAAYINAKRILHPGCTI